MFTLPGSGSLQAKDAAGLAGWELTVAAQITYTGHGATHAFSLHQPR